MAIVRPQRAAIEGLLAKHPDSGSADGVFPDLTRVRKPKFFLDGGGSRALRFLGLSRPNGIYRACGAKVAVFCIAAGSRETQKANEDDRRELPEARFAVLLTGAPAAGKNGGRFQEVELLKVSPRAGAAAGSVSARAPIRLKRTGAADRYPVLVTD